MFVVCPLKPGTMSPPMFLMIFNAMLTGTVASSIAAYQPSSQRMAIIVAGIAFQGLGWILCILFLPLFVGSSGYTIVALIGCAKAIPDEYGYFANHPTASETLNVVALWIGIFLWLFTFWLFAIALVAHSTHYDSKWGNSMLEATDELHTSLVGHHLPQCWLHNCHDLHWRGAGNQRYSWLQTAMTVLIFAAWLMDLFLHLKSIFQKRIM
ncbi:C4-dicarboxylate transporter/malic acid transport protein [Penicillium robsamsonii]|uniref:C4-dicarboxylate transporter/malic acid transport protein n=1 Tax=Penicillium robsamsonii TaxID=1792511 RepID=UPI0025487C60|nr:C4-dicarboxylate transporter/malic acid transport protein [Penicillium robsamsonii]KAJ5807320.1 C4-dicarboxylate transporter/malic acid transport protein [Penicillium robsamsonii]